MTDDEDAAAEKTAKGARTWLTNRAGLIILVVIAAIVGLKLMASWLKWMLLAMVVAAIVYLVRGARRRMDR